MKKPDLSKFEALRYRYIAMAVSGAFLIIGAVLFLTLGFNTGIDFGSGYSESLQIAPLAFTVSYTGDRSAVVSVAADTLVVTFRDADGVETVSLDAKAYPTAADVAAELEKHGLDVSLSDGSLRTENLVTGFGYPSVLSLAPFRVNFSTDSVDVTIEDVRRALDGLDGVKVQTVGSRNSGSYQVRLAVDEGEGQAEVQDRLNSLLYEAFGEENIVILQADFVGPKFSSSLFHDSVVGLLIALALILLYVSIRFRIAYALSAILALLHDVLAMLTFVLVFRLEVSSTTIAAVLTIVGYSLNNTIVIFDRVRENVSFDRTALVEKQINLAVRKSVSRTLITSVTTLLAIVPLAVFSSGDIKLFAINLTWGIVAGTYSSNFLAPAFLYYFNKKLPINVEKKKEEENYSLV